MKDNSFILGMANTIKDGDIVNGDFFSVPLDVSAYTDISSGRMLRIKDIQVRVTDDENLPLNPLVTTQKATDSECEVDWHLSTSQKDYNISLDDTNVIASQIMYFLASFPQDVWLDVITAFDHGPAAFEDGFLAATDTLWLTVRTDNFDTGVSPYVKGLKVSLQMECEQVKVSRGDALAIAVAQASSQ